MDFEVSEQEIASLLGDDDFVYDYPVQNNVYHTFGPRSSYSDADIYNILLHSKTIKNDFSFCQSYDKRINLPDHWLYCKGYHAPSQTYMVYKVKILNCDSIPLQGRHCIQIENQEPVWVNSLTSFRRDILHFTDQVSFERCTFFVEIIDNELKIVRLKLIRNLLFINGGVETYSETLCKKGEEQVSKLIHQIQQIYYRDTGCKPSVFIKL